MIPSLIMILGGILLISLSKDLGRAIRWFLRSLGRVMIVVCIIAFGYMLLFTSYR